MKKILFLLCFYTSASLNAQNNYFIKEFYDQVLSPNYASFENEPKNNTKWIHSWGDLLLSYIRMYEATNDKAYLLKFVKYSKDIQDLRNIYPPIWKTAIDNVVPDSETHSYYVLYTGRTVRPMAEFIYLIKKDNILTNLQLPSKLQSTSITTYGEYADYLLIRIKQSIDYINKSYWISDRNCYDKSLYPNSRANPIEMNFSASYAVAMMYVAAVDMNKFVEYNYKAYCIINLYKRNTSLSENSYVWFHKESKNKDILFEDVNHGVFDIQIPLIAHQLYGTKYYYWSDLNKFAHTFTYNIWDRNKVQFNNTVYGTISGGYNEETCNYKSNGTPNFYGFGEILGWMPLYKYDDVNAYPNDIYSILLNHTIKLLADDPTALRPPATCPAHLLSGTTSLFGLTEVVKAQWDREDYNLRLFNRELTYDQDFCAKKKLIVEPNEKLNEHDLTQGSFADPAFTDNKFIVKSGTTVKMTAGERITFLPGTVIEAGSTFTASITPDGCPQKKQSKGSGNATMFSDEILDSLMLEVDKLIKEDSLKEVGQHGENPFTLKQKNTQAIQNEQELLPFTVFPNPVHDMVTLTIPVKEGTPITVELLDYTGRQIYFNEQPYNHYMQIPTVSLNKGFCLVRIKTYNQQFSSVLVKE